MMPDQTDGLVDPGRRDVLAAGAALGASFGAVLGGGAALVSASSPARAGTELRSPPTTPFLVPLPVYAPKAPVAALLPAAGRLPSGQEAGRAPHQRSAEFVPKKFYELRVKPLQHSFHPELPTQTMWGYDGMLPGPTFVARYHEPVVVRIFNELPANHVGYGAPEISTHLHNAHCASESDGFPGDYYSATKSGPTLTSPGKYKDHLYHNMLAGYDQYPATRGDPREALGTLWYHDHRIDFSSQNVYKGLAGFYLLFDEIDSGNENDTNPKALRLPSGVGKYDIPLAIQDRQFDSRGHVVFDQFETDGFLGDKICVNGKIQPYFKVERRKYRFRLLNASLARFYEFYLASTSGDQPFTYIANDGNLLPKPLSMTKIRIAPGERADLVIDFADYPLGSKLTLVNKLEQHDGRQPSGRLLAAPDQVLRFDIDAEPPLPDASRVPALLRELPPINLADVVRTREWRFDRVNGVWAVNGKLFNVYEPAATVKKGSAEIWVLRGGGEWQHPVHLHMEEFRILSRNRVAPPPHEQGRKDVVTLGHEEEVRIFVRFRDYVGKYVMHCHNLTHEDHGMMVRFDVVA